MRIIFILIFLCPMAGATELDNKLNYYLSRKYTFEVTMNELKSITGQQVKFINRIYAQNEKKKENLTRLQNIRWPSEKEMMAFQMNKIIRE